MNVSALREVYRNRGPAVLPGLWRLNRAHRSTAPPTNRARPVRAGAVGFPVRVVAPFVVAFCLVLLVVLASVPLQGTFQSVGSVWGAEPSGQNSAAPSIQTSPTREPHPTPHRNPRRHAVCHRHKM